MNPNEMRIKLTHKNKEVKFEMFNFDDTLVRDRFFRSKHGLCFVVVYFTTIMSDNNIFIASQYENSSDVKEYENEEEAKSFFDIAKKSLYEYAEHYGTKPVRSTDSKDNNTGEEYSELWVIKNV